MMEYKCLTCRVSYKTVKDFAEHLNLNPKHKYVMGIGNKDLRPRLDLWTWLQIYFGEQVSNSSEYNQ